MSDMKCSLACQVSLKHLLAGWIWTIAERVNEKTGISIAIAPQAIDIAAVTVSSETPVFAQHIDPVYYGKYTGHILPEAVAEAGAYGTLLNHSEHQIPLDKIEAAIKRCGEILLEKGFDKTPDDVNELRDELRIE